MPSMDGPQSEIPRSAAPQVTRAGSHSPPELIGDERPRGRPDEPFATLEPSGPLIVRAHGHAPGSAGVSLQRRVGIIGRVADAFPSDLFKNVVSARRFADEKMQKVNLFETERMFCDIYCLQPGQAQKVHAHAGADKVYFVLQGTVTVILDGAEMQVQPQQTVLAPADMPHGLRNDSDGNVVCLVTMGPHNLKSHGPPLPR